MKKRNFKRDKKIIYIAGYGRSGSTILGRILGSNKAIFATGELANLIFEIGQKDKCSCGKQLQKCNFWSRVIQAIKKNSEFKKERYKKIGKENLFNFFNLFLNKKEYFQYHKSLIYSIFQFLDDEVRFLVDSSKTARDRLFRPFLIGEIFNLKLIHLIRNPQACLFSNLKGSNKKIEKRVKDPHLSFAFLKTILHWPIANLSATIFKIIFPKKYLMIKYEDLVLNPLLALKKIENFLKIDLSIQKRIIEKGQNIPLSHQISGNRLRSKKEIVLRANMEWEQKLSMAYRILICFFLWPFMLFYGYLGQ